MNCPNCNTYTANSNFCSRQCCATYWSVYKTVHKVERFWAKADIRHFGSPFLLAFCCWPYTTRTGKHNQRPGGYAWKTSRNAEIPPGHQINHHCDNPPCINPWHLYAGTPRQNMRDKYDRRRNDTHRDPNNAKITIVEVREIRNKWDANVGTMTYAELARIIALEYNTTPRVIARIGYRETWIHTLEESG